MNIKNTIELTISHLRAKVRDLETHDPHRTHDQETAIYWCGRQTGTTLIDFLEAFQHEGIINSDELISYRERILAQYRLLDRVYRANSH